MKNVLINDGKTITHSVYPGENESKVEFFRIKILGFRQSGKVTVAVNAQTEHFISCVKRDQVTGGDSLT